MQTKAVESGTHAVSLYPLAKFKVALPQHYHLVYPAAETRSRIRLAQIKPSSSHITFPRPRSPYPDGAGVDHCGQLFSLVAHFAIAQDDDALDIDSGY